MSCEIRPATANDVPVLPALVEQYREFKELA